MTAPSILIDAAELAARRSQPGLRVVDASWYLPAMQRDARAEFEAGHIPGAVFLDQDTAVDPRSPLPHTLPSAQRFGEIAGELGISNGDTIVVYDGAGLFSAARVWWLFRTFGAGDVRVLDGGLPAWKAAGMAVESGPARPAPARFEARLDEPSLVGFEEMRNIVSSGRTQIADARSAERFAGTAPEPREGVRGGHMPGATSLPFGNLVENGRLKPPEALEAAFAQAGLDPDRPLVTTCGSGVTAAVINFALAATGRDPGRLYDGSWAEWGSRPDTPVENGTGTPN